MKLYTAILTLDGSAPDALVPSTLSLDWEVPMMKTRVVRSLLNIAVQQLTCNKLSKNNTDI